MEKNRVSTGNKIGYILLVAAFAAIGGFFGFLANQIFQLSGIHSDFLQLALILGGVLIVLGLVFLILRSTAKEGKRRYAAAGNSADSSDMSFFSFVALGAGTPDSGVHSGGGWFGNSDGGWFGGGDSGGGFSGGDSGGGFSGGDSGSF